MSSADAQPPDGAERSRFATSLGAVCATAGVAIGLGNVWRFPYMMGSWGGSAFLLLYLAMMVAFGLPMLMAEWSLGRATKRGPWGAYERAGTPFARTISAVVLVTITMAASYYGVVVAWTLQEAWAYTANGEGQGFGALTASFSDQFVFLFITVSLGCAVLSLGVKGGVQRASQLVLPLFFVLFVLILVRVLTLDGAIAGLKTFLVPDARCLTSASALAAMGQAVFSLGLGGMFMVLYGSYMREDVSIPRAAIGTVVADVSAALLAGLIVVPAVLAFSMDLSSGPGLMFDTMPAVFSQAPAGRLVGAAFFVAVFAVAMLSLIAAYEALVAALMDGLGWSRRNALVAIFLSQLALAVPAYLVGPYIQVSDFFWGSTMQPIGAAFAVFAVGWSLGRTRTLEQMRRDANLPVPEWLFYWIKYVIPFAILAILVWGWWDGFGDIREVFTKGTPE